MPLVPILKWVLKWARDYLGIHDNFYSHHSSETMTHHSSASSHDGLTLRQVVIYKGPLQDVVLGTRGKSHQTVNSGPERTSQL